MTKSTMAFMSGAALATLIGASSALAPQGEEKPLDSQELKSMIVNLGYAAKDLGTDPAKPKFELTITQGGFDIPIAAEVTASKRFIWLTAFLGEKSKMADFDARASKFLDSNYSIQPTQWYTTSKGNLMIGIAIENRNVTPAHLKWRIEKIAGDVVNTKDLWNR